MKTSFVIITAAALVASVTPNSRALPPEVQEAHQRAFEVVKEIRDTLVPAPVIRFVESFPPVAGPRRAVLHLAQVTPPSAANKPTPPPPLSGLPGVDPDSVAEWANSFAVSTARSALGGVFGDSKGTKRPVIVGSDVKTIPAIEEDLNVMMRILDKSAGGREEKGATAMGIDVFSFGDGSGSPRMFYIEDYGAMFMLNVKYPLLAPPPKGEETRTNETTNSEWERARQELYGVKLQDARNPWREAAAEQFDEERVEKLKTQLINDLVNAAHIRHLKADDWITVVVLGGSRGAVSHHQPVRAMAGGRGGYAASAQFHTRISSGTQTTMALRVKKSDADAFAKGKLKAEEFRKKVSVQVY